MQEWLEGFVILSAQVRENFVSVQKEKGDLNLRLRRQIPIIKGQLVFISKIS